MRVCETCRAAENPIGRLRFKKSEIDGKIYCERCNPGQSPVGLGTEGAPLAVSSPSLKPSAGYVVIACPNCAGGVHRSNRSKTCIACSGYGAVRIDVSFLNVYRPTLDTLPGIIEEV